jgi:iron complex outermembrane receptor protein
LYGADAISGVVNIITRFDPPATGGARTTAYSAAGVSNSNYASPGLAQDHRLTFGLGSPMRSARIGVSYSSLGDYYQGSASHRLAANGGFRQVLESGVVTGTARLFTSESGVPVNPLTLAPASGNSTSAPPAPSSSNQEQALTAYTVGANARLVSGTRWTHNLVAGIDGYRLKNFANEFTPFPSGTDSALQAARGGADRTTARANTTVRLGDDDHFSVNVSGAAEHSLLRQETPVISLGAARPGETPQRTTVEWFHDLGVSSQVDIAVDQRFFVTAGLRVERNDGYVTLPRFSTLPMVGASYVLDAGPATLKFRAAFGRGMRAPRTAARETMFGGVQEQASIRELAPEQQSGLEAGVDLFVAKYFSFQVTGFDQLASGLIQQVVVPDSSGTGPQRQPDRLSLVYQNVGAITNRGWEFQAAMHVRGLSIGASATITRSRVQNVASTYTGDLRAGDLVIGVPARTVGTTIGWAGGPWSLSIGATRALDWSEYDRIALAQAYSHFDRRDVPLFGADLRGYWRDYTGNTRLRASISRAFTRSISAVLTGENLLGYQVGEPDNATIVPGRTIATGLRVSWF